MTNRTADQIAFDRAEAGVCEEVLTLDRLSLVDALAKGERHEQTEQRIMLMLFKGDEWQRMNAWDRFRLGCAVNGRPVEINERLLRTTIYLYGLYFSDSPAEFRTVGVY